ncbi:MAG: N-acyl homoserine lactonase family protein [Actinomycetota bacterium]|nr:N-acyl homoserine lactonase family protein [Actinomycetota bacterium]
MERGPGVRRVIALTLGWERLPKTVSVHGDTSGEILVEPVPGVLLECDGGWVLLDTGFNPALLRDPALRRRFHDPAHGIEAILPGPGEPLEEALEGAGIAVEDIRAVAVSHLHNDHAGGLRLFAATTPVHVQRAELDYGLGSHPEPERHGIYRVDFDDPRLDWQVADGDTEIAPGVTAILTAGHTPGHQSFVVDVDPSAGSGGFVFAFDAADLTENLDREVAVGGYIDCEPEATVEAIRRLKALAAERGYPVIPGHDPVAWPSLTEELAARWPTAARSARIANAVNEQP